VKRDEALAILERAEPVCTAQAARAAVERVAGEITASVGGEFPMVLAVMGGAVVFAGQLLPLLAFPLEFRAIEVTRYANTTSGREVEWRLAPTQDVGGRTVLVLDDILDEGVTLAAVRAKLLGLGASRVLTAVFADKDIGREKPIAADFVGVRVPDRYVFGFGMDAFGVWRNLPAVYALGGR
jgi:hypoxanthine phosphoribosyltransferase